MVAATLAKSTRADAVKKTKDAKKKSSASKRKSQSNIKDTAMLGLIGCRVNIETTDGLLVVGKLLAFDKERNVILSDAERFRKHKSGKTERENLGLVFIRGTSVGSMSYTPSVISGPLVVDSRCRR